MGRETHVWAWGSIKHSFFFLSRAPVCQRTSNIRKILLSCIQLPTLHVAKQELLAWIYPCKVDKGMYRPRQIVISRTKVVTSSEFLDRIIETPTGEQRCCKKSEVGHGAAPRCWKRFNFSIEGIFEVEVKCWEHINTIIPPCTIQRTYQGFLRHQPLEQIRRTSVLFHRIVPKAWARRSMLKS